MPILQHYIEVIELAAIDPDSLPGRDPLRNNARLFSRLRIDATCFRVMSSSFSRTHRWGSNGRHALRTTGQPVNGSSTLRALQWLTGRSQFQTLRIEAVPVNSRRDIERGSTRELWEAVRVAHPAADRFSELDRGESRQGRNDYRSGVLSARSSGVRKL